jgi:hypothetical protein
MVVRFVQVLVRSCRALCVPPPRGKARSGDGRGEVGVEVVEEEEEEHAMLTELGYFSPPAPLLFLSLRGVVIGSRLDVRVRSGGCVCERVA